jgi:hypothetical protein
LSKRRIMLPMLVALVGAGVGMWAMITPARGSAIVLEPLQITKTAADGEHFLPGVNAYYQISIHNPNDVTVYLDNLVDQLPSGFSYNADSASGLVSFNPDESGQTLTWVFDGENVGGLQTVTLNFSVSISDVEPVGMYCNQATITSDAGVSSTGLTAPMQVLNEGDTQVTPTCPSRGLVHSATPTASATAPATKTPVPSTSTPVPPSATATSPTGGSAGAISAPDTGTGPSDGGPSAMLLAVATLLVVGGLGSAVVGTIRR